MFEIYLTDEKKVTVEDYKSPYTFSFPAERVRSLDSRTSLYSVKEGFIITFREEYVPFVTANKIYKMGGSTLKVVDVGLSNAYVDITMVFNNVTYLLYSWIRGMLGESESFFTRGLSFYIAVLKDVPSGYSDIGVFFNLN